MIKEIHPVPTDINDPMFRPQNHVPAGKVVFFDTETNKLHGNVVSLCAIMCTFNDAMSEVYIEDVLMFYRYDGDMDQESQKFTGLTPDFLKENDNSAEGIKKFLEMIDQADVVVAHNVGYDIASVERTWPETVPQMSAINWACSVADINWGHPDRDIRTAVLDYIAFRAGYYNGSPHDAQADVLTTICALLGVMPDGVLPLTELISNSMLDAYKIALPGLPFELKDEAKKIGFRWNPDEKVWFKIANGKPVAKEILSQVTVFFKNPTVDIIHENKRVYVSAVN